ncbi:MAG TPA: DUF3667 domain-containing protein [Chitinophagaceae bacterium]
MDACKNCGEPLEKNYCAFCGQKASVKRIELKHLLHDIPHAIFHVDSGFFYNVKHLFIRPGAAIKDYLAGQRKFFFHPITYLAILMVFNYFAVKITNLHYYDEAELLKMSPKEAALIKQYDATQWWFLEHTYLYMLIAIPACTLFCYFFFRLFKYRFNIAENSIIVMFIIAQGVLLQSTLYLVTGWVHNGSFIRAIEMLNVVNLVSYASYAVYSLVAPVKNKLWITLVSVIGGGIILSLMVASAYWLLYLSEIFA